MTLRSNGLAIQIWEDLTAHDPHHNVLGDPRTRAEWERIEKLRTHARWVDSALLPCMAYLSLTGATLAVPWARLGQTEQIVFTIGLVSLWGAALWRSFIGGGSPKLLTAIVLARRFRPGQHVWIQAVRPGFVHGIVTARTRTRVVVRPLSQNSPIPLSPLEVCMLPKEDVQVPVVGHRSPYPSPSVSE